MAEIIEFSPFDREEEQRKLAEEADEIVRLTTSMRARMRRLNPRCRVRDPDALSITQRMARLELENA